MARLFGTDGVRGIANEELTSELAYKLGQAAALVLTEAIHRRPKILIGRDTRISGDMLEAALTAGICSVGGDVVLLSVVPTPAVAMLVKKYGACAGVMVSASHNTFEHNGIKLFSGEGYKLRDAMEDMIEELIMTGGAKLKTGAEIGRVEHSETAVQDYASDVASLAKGALGALRFAADCGNGSASATFSKIAKAIGAKAVLINDRPDGININHNCGSTHMEALAEFVVANGLDFGVAFDGDADRMLAVDELGNIVDGDYLMAIFASGMKDEGQLKNNALVCTTMSNLGLHELAASRGIDLKITDVGDRYVLEEMKKHGHSLGGEASGHIIFSRYSTTGDGQVAAVQLLNILAASGKKLSELTGLMRKYPQVMVNVKVSTAAKQAYAKDEAVKRAIADAEAELAGAGRVIVRASGTEPLVRVMIEGREEETIARLARGIADKIELAGAAAV